MAFLLPLAPFAVEIAVGAGISVGAAAVGGIAYLHVINKLENKFKSECKRHEALNTELAELEYKL
jgi:hypothetical protein